MTRKEYRKGYYLQDDEYHTCLHMDSLVMWIEHIFFGKYIEKTMSYKKAFNKFMGLNEAMNHASLLVVETSVYGIRLKGSKKYLFEHNLWDVIIEDN